MIDEFRLPDLSVRIFADGADVESIQAMACKPWIAGFTTNPSLLRKAGVTDYQAFARQVLSVIPDRPVSFEVVADDLPTIEAQALAIGSWGPNANVKIPVTTTKGEPCTDVIARVARQGVTVNVTAIMTLEHIWELTNAIPAETPTIFSVFAGRIADTGRDPVPVMKQAADIMKRRPMAELLWASPREVLNVFQADAIGCHIITLTNDLIAKLALHDKDLAQFSLETVEMFRRDALAADLHIDVAAAPPAGGQLRAAEAAAPIR